MSATSKTHPRSPLPFKPIAIAVETVKLLKGSNDLKVAGIDLDSGRRVKIKIEYADYAPRAVDPISGLVITLNLERILS